MFGLQSGSQTCIGFPHIAPVIKARKGNDAPIGALALAIISVILMCQIRLMAPEKAIINDLNKEVLGRWDLLEYGFDRPDNDESLIIDHNGIIKNHGRDSIVSLKKKPTNIYNNIDPIVPPNLCLFSFFPELYLKA